MAYLMSCIHVDLQREGEEREDEGEEREALKHCSFIRQSAKIWTFLPRSLLNACGYLASKKKKGDLILLCMLRQSEFSEKNF